jgi:hypothetical protein
MKTYDAYFYGRQRGALGICYNIHTTVQGKNEEEARLKLYDRFDDVLRLQLKECEPIRIEPV